MGPYVGIKFALTTQGFSFCGEAGVGIGVGIEVDPLEGLDKNGQTSIVAEVGTQLGPVGVSGKLERELTDGPCPGETKGEVKGCVAVLCGKVNNDGFGGNLSLAEIAGVEAQAKVTGKKCWAGTWD